MGPRVGIRWARVSLTLSRALFSWVALTASAEASPPRAVVGGPETAESGGVELSDGRRPVPQAFSEDFPWGLPFSYCFWLLAVGEFCGSAAAARLS